MKTFAFYLTPGKTNANGNSTDTVTVYQIVGNVPRRIAHGPRSYRTAAQAAVEMAVGAGKLGIAHKGKTPARLENDCIARFFEL